MGSPADGSIRRLEEQLEGAERALASLRRLDQKDAERVGERMDRLASQLLAATEPRRMAEVHSDLGTQPLDQEAASGLADQMGAPDGEG